MILELQTSKIQKKQNHFLFPFKSGSWFLVKTRSKKKKKSWLNAKTNVFSWFVMFFSFLLDNLYLWKADGTFTHTAEKHAMQLYGGVCVCFFFLWGCCVASNRVWEGLTELNNGMAGLVCWWVLVCKKQAKKQVND